MTTGTCTACHTPHNHLNALFSPLTAALKQFSL